MKKILLILVWFIPVLAVAQSQDQNYVKTTTYKQPTITSIQNPTIEQANVQISYFDGLGRPIQQIASKQSATGKDIVTHIEYDAFGRQVRDYLPYVPTGSASLSYISTANTDVINYYSSQYQTSVAFSEKQLESSPLNRVFKQAAPGDNWAMGSGHEIKIDYQTNIANDVKKFTVTLTPPSATNQPYGISIAQNGFYAENQLYKTITKDENWTTGNDNTTHEFKNKEGQVILKRTFNNEEPHETYYVYDQFGNLTYVIPPLAEGNPSVSNLEKLCYQYKYDYRNRVVEKKLPGKQWEFIVYDKLDRPIATGPAFSPFGDSSQGWMITKYDAFGRVAYTGWYNGAATTVAGRNSIQNQLNTATILFENRGTSTNIDNINVGYTNTAFPTSSCKILTINYYDNYTYPDAPSLPSDIMGASLATNVKGLPTGSWVRVLQGASNTNAELSYTLYDDKYRPIRSYTKNYLDGFTQVDSDLDDFNGKVLQTVTTHKRTSADSPLIVTETFEYTPQDRLYKHKHQIYGEAEVTLTENSYDELGQLILKTTGGGLQDVDYKYNIRGWLTSINEEETAQSENGYVQLGTGDLFAFKISYDHLLVNNIAGVKELFNGNIAETQWITSTDNTMRHYGYQYDDLNRLLNASFRKPTIGDEENAYNESLNYDKNGNIKHLDRWSKLQNGYINQIDDLTYTYDGNQLNIVGDQTASPQGFKDGNTIDLDYKYDDNGNMIEDKNKGITKIYYNHLNLPTKIEFGEGNIITYLYNAVGQKVYKNVINGVEFADTYYLNGFQHRSSYTQAQGTYIEPTLEYFPTAEGYVQYKDSRYFYIYHYTDHLGNIRLSYTLDPETQMIKIMEENHYYPFGLKHQFYNSQVLQFKGETLENGSTKVALKEKLGFVGDGSYNYKYQGQERQDELGLNWDSFKWRNYDYAIGRFMSIDPLAEKYAYNSTYAFQENKMGLGVELEGLELWPSPLTGVFLAETTKPTIVEEIMLRPAAETASKIEEHHLIPNQAKELEIVKTARDEGFKFDGAENKIPLEKFSKATGEGQHGNHPKYNKGVIDKIAEFAKTNENVSPQEALKFIRDLSSNLEQIIKSNPDKKVNDILNLKTVAVDKTLVKIPEIKVEGEKKFKKKEITNDEINL